MTGKTAKQFAARDAKIIAAIVSGSVTRASLAELFGADRRSMGRTLERLYKSRRIGPGGWKDRSVVWTVREAGK